MRGIVVTLLVLIAFGTIAALVWWSSTRHELVPPTVRYSTVDEWNLFFDKHTTDTGWIHIPVASDTPAFKSHDDPFTKGWVKPAVCGECHDDIWKRFQSTAHFLTSVEPSPKTVLGPIGDNPHIMRTRDERLSFELARKDGRYLQTVNFRDANTKFSHSESIDLVTGSGNHGQTYLFWKGDALYQLPISYFSESHSWVNSPGMYVDGTADFGRPIGDRCLDCHLTYIAAMPNAFHRYDRSSAILGVTCVRCHGSGWAHVQFHRTHPDAEARYITNPTRLTRDRTNEVCAQCHSGVGQLLRPTFSYQPGEPLEAYLHLQETDQDVTNDDPHAANQLARLRRSKCYEKSDSMTCVACHDPHQQERGDASLFSRRCHQCHQPTQCGMHPKLGDKINDSCIKCHMAAKRDTTGRMETSQGEVLPKLRDHYIRVLPELSQDISESLRKS